MKDINSLTESHVNYTSDQFRMYRIYGASRKEKANVRLPGGTTMQLKGLCVDVIDKKAMTDVGYGLWNQYRSREFASLAKLVYSRSVRVT